MDTRIQRVIVPRHFGQRWDKLLEGREDWTVVDEPVLWDRIRMVRNHEPVVCVSGDCMAALGAHRPNLTLVWLDAHGDFQTPQTTRTGNLGGMPLAMMHGLGWQTYVTVAAQQKPIKKSYFHGGSSFDPGEEHSMRLNGVILSDLPKSGTWTHLHIDTDIVSSNVVQGAVHPSPDGMELRDFHQLYTEILNELQVKVLSVKTPNPALDVDGSGRRLVDDILREFDEYYR